MPAVIPPTVQNDLQAVFDARDASQAAGAALPPLNDAIATAQATHNAAVGDANAKAQAVVDARAKFEADLAAALMAPGTLPTSLTISSS